MAETIEAPRLFTAFGAETIDTQGRQWIEVMPTADKMRNGPWFFTVTADDLEVYAQSIRDNPDKIPVDYEHAAQSSRAAGWFTGQAEVRAGKLWAEVQWTPKARQEITDGEYRYISPEFTFTEKDSKTGLMTKAKQMLAAALTNKPAFKELAPVAEEITVDKLGDLLAKAATADGMTVTFDPEDIVVLQALDDLLDEVLGEPEPEDAANAEVRAKVIQALTDTVKAATWTTAFINDLPDSSFLYIEPGGTKDGEGKTTPRSLRHLPVKDKGGTVDLPHVRNALARIPQSGIPADAKSRATAAAQRLLSNAGGNPSAENEGDEQMDFDAMFKALGLDADADANKKIKAVLAKQAEDNLALQAEVTELKAAQGETVQLNERIKELEVRDRQRDIEVVLAKAVDKGQVLPAEKESLEAYGEAVGVNELRTLLAKRPEGFAHARGKEHGSGGKGPISFDDPDTRALARRMGINEDEAAVDDESAQLQIRAEAILKEKGVTSPTSEDWMEAYTAAERVGAAY